MKLVHEVVIAASVVVFVQSNVFLELFIAQNVDYHRDDGIILEQHANVKFNFLLKITEAKTVMILQEAYKEHAMNEWAESRFLIFKTVAFHSKIKIVQCSTSRTDKNVEKINADRRWSSRIDKSALEYLLTLFVPKSQNKT